MNQPDTPNPELEQRRDKRIATGFSEDPEMERLLEMRDKQPDKFEQLGSFFHMSVGYYASAKAAAQRLERSNR